MSASPVDTAACLVIIFTSVLGSNTAEQVPQHQSRRRESLNEPDYGSTSFWHGSAAIDTFRVIEPRSTHVFRYC